MKTWTLVLVSLLVSCGKEEPPTGIEYPLRPIETRGSITAAYRYDQVVSAAIARESTVRLKRIDGLGLSTNGTSHCWCYTFGTSVPPGRYYHFTAEYDSVRFDSTSNATVGDAFITHPWMNSCDAMVIAEAFGGGLFRKENPDFTIRASLGEAVVPDAITYWRITYRSNVSARALHLSIDATTGMVLKPNGSIP